MSSSLARAVASDTVLTAANDNCHLRLVRTNCTVSTGWGYDTNANDRRLISIANSGITRSFALNYGSGPVNVYDIMGITDTAATGHPFATQSHGYSYDNVDRLLTASSTTPGNYSYGYDNLDNATSVTDPAIGSLSPTYNVLNQLTAFNLNSYTYDNNGNTTSDGLTKTYKWDAENRLIEIDYTGTSNKSSFSYDGLGRRTVDAETIGGVTTTTRYLWCGSRICQTRNGSDVVQSRVLDEGELNVISGQKAVYMPDQLGSVRDVLDATTGNLISSIDYSPYGNPVATNGGFVPFYQYGGLAYHPQSGLMMSATRFYDPIAPHWLSKDWIKEYGGWNLYAYGPDVINGTDPEGFEFAIIPRLPGLPTLLPPIFMPGSPANQQFVHSTKGFINWISGDHCPPNDTVLPADKAPGKPTEDDGFVPPKGQSIGDIGKADNPNGPGTGWGPDKDGGVWVPTGTAGAPGTGTTGPAHGGPHWDVQYPRGKYRNVFPGGGSR